MSHSVHQEIVIEVLLSIEELHYEENSVVRQSIILLASHSVNQSVSSSASEVMYEQI